MMSPNESEGKPAANCLVSVIVPAHNCDAYLDRCISSLQKQTYSSIEILLIDDGSEDDTLLKANLLASGDARINVISQMNQGVSAARNNGLRHARGQYMCFVDADDWVEADFIQNLIEGFNGPMIDMTICDYDLVSDKDEHLKKRKEQKSGVISSGKALKKAIGHGYFQTFACNKCFRNEIIRANGLRFDCNISAGEDMVFVVEYLLKCRSVNVISNCLYHYYQRPDSTIHSPGRHMHKYRTMISGYDKVQEMLFGHRKCARIIRGRNVINIANVIQLMYLARQTDDAWVHQALSRVRKDYWLTMRYQCGLPRERILAGLCCISPSLAVSFSRLHLDAWKRLAQKVLRLFNIHSVWL